MNPKQDHPSKSQSTSPGDVNPSDSVDTEVDTEIEGEGEGTDINATSVDAADSEEVLVDNINDDRQGINPNADLDDEGVDNIDETQEELKEDMKGDSLGGTTQLPETATQDKEKLPQRSG